MNKNAFLYDFMGYEVCEHCIKIHNPLTRAIHFSEIVSTFISAYSHKQSILIILLKCLCGPLLVNEISCMQINKYVIKIED